MIGRVFADRYQLTEFIGKGGMALVYRATDLRTGHQVAVKILRPEFNQNEEFLSRFQREATAASKMSHHNIVNLLDVGMDGECRYLVMEYVQGKTLKAVIREKGKMPPTVAAQIAIRILSALQHAHKNGIIHRDIKPQNILVHSEGHIKVADFGIARVADSNTISRADSVMGSVHYFSPEQARGDDVTFASDIYSVGVVFYEMLTGQVPFDGETPVAIALQHISATPRPISQLTPDVPAAMEHVVGIAMEKDPSLRYQSALEMAQDLQRALHEPEGNWAERTQDPPIPLIAQTARPGGKRPPRPPRRFWQRRFVRIAALALLSAAVLIALYAGSIAIYESVMSAAEAPDLVGQEESVALRLIERAGLKAQIERACHSTVAAGMVILQEPEYDTAMKKGETILITVSTGPEQKAVPGVVGQLSGDAQSALEMLGFSMLVVNRVVSTKIPETVLTQLPEEGTNMYAGGIVQVTVSGGSALVPDLKGLTLDNARELLEQNELTLGAVGMLLVTDETQVGLIVAQDFEHGEQVLPGTAVGVTVNQLDTRRYLGEVTLALPEREGGVQVRVTLVMPDGTESEQYAAMHPQDGDLSPTIPLRSETAGIMLCRIYCDGELYEEKEVTLS